MSPTKPVASIIIPNWNGQEFLKVVLPSLAKQRFKDFETVIVDNGSTDESVGYLEKHWPNVRLIKLPENLGFAKAVNHGLEVSQGEFVVLLNNDVEARPAWLGELLRPFTDDRQIGFTTSKILRFTDQKVIDEAGHDVSLYGLTVPRGFGWRDTGQYDQPAETVVATGGASAYRRSLFDALGGLDEDYFFYYEDADLCLRARWLGYRGIYVPTAVVYHHGGGTAGRVSRFTRVNVTRNLLITILKDFPLSALLLGGWKINFHQARLFLSAIRQGWLGAYLEGWLRFLAAAPKTLVKRRRLMRRRKIASTKFNEALLPFYPLPTRYSSSSARSSGRSSRATPSNNNGGRHG